MTATTKRWDIFLSYSHNDKTFVDWLHRKLVDARLTTWYDKEEILLGDSITTKIAEGLGSSNFHIVVLSQTAVQSNWVKAELEPRLNRQIEEGKVRIICVVLDSVKPKEISELLRDKIYIEFSREGSDETFVELQRHIRAHNSY